MNETIGNIPGNTEIRIEREILLNRNCIRNSPSKAAVLQVIVDGHLKGETLDGNAIGLRAFPNFVPNHSSDVRVHAKSLRKTLKEYYTDEGIRDAVVIEIEEGRNYPMNAFYNPKNEAVKYYLKALGWMSEETSYPWYTLDALAFCKYAINADPNFAPAYALYSEYLLCLASNSRANPNEYGHGPYKGRRKLPECIGLAREFALKAVRLNKRDWRAHVAMGAYRACCNMWSAAEHSFKEAFELSPSETTADPWYCFYLFAVARYEEALKIVRERSSEAPRGSFWRGLLPLFEYVGGHSIYAPFHVNQREGRAFITMAAEACMYLGRAKYRKEQRRWAMCAFDRFFEEFQESFGNPVASLGLWALVSGEAGEPEKANEILNSMRYRGRPNFGGKRYQALDRCAEPGIGWTPEAREIKDHANYAVDDRWKGRCDCPWEMALACLGVGWHKAAFAALEQARKEHHPMMMWLHHWWFLEPLHKYAEFSELVLRMNLPHLTEDQVRARFWGKETIGPEM